MEVSLFLYFEQGCATSEYGGYNECSQPNFWVLLTSCTLQIPKHIVCPVASWKLDVPIFLMIVCSLLCIWVCNLWMMVQMTKILCQAWGNQTLAVHPTWLFFTYARYALVCYHLCWGDDILVFTFIKLKGLFLTNLYLQFCLMAAMDIEMLTFPLLNFILVSRSNFSTLAYFWQSEDHISFWQGVHRHLVIFCVKLDDDFLQVGLLCSFLQLGWFQHHTQNWRFW
jgi:hypothetical protein